MGQFILAIASLVRGKVLSHTLGPALFGEYTSAIVAAGFFYMFAQLGLGLGLSRNVAAAESMEERQNLLGAGNALTLSASLLGFLVCLGIVLSGQAHALFGFNNFGVMPIVLLILVAIAPAETWRSNFYAVLQGLIDIKGMSAERAYGVLAVTIVTVPVVYYYGLYGAVFQTVLLSIMLMLVHARRVHHHQITPWKIKWNKKQGVLLARYGVASLAAGSLLLLTDVLLRTRLTSSVGLYNLGLYDSATNLAVQVRSIFLSGISAYALSALSQAKTKEEQSKSGVDVMKIVLPIATMIMGLLAISAPLIILILTDKRYVPGSRIMGFTVIGDYLQTVVYIIGTPLLAQGRVKTWLIIELVLIALRYVIAASLVTSLGIAAIPVGMLIAMSIHVVITYVVYFRVCELTMPIQLVYRFLLGLVVLGVIAYLILEHGSQGRALSLLLLLAVGSYDFYKLNGLQKIRNYFVKRKQPAN